MSMMTFGTLYKHDSALWQADNDREKRIRVRTSSGMQIGLPGVGENENKLTFPRRYLVGDALKAQWIRFASESDTLELPVGFQRTWWAISEVQPKSLVQAPRLGLQTPVSSVSSVGCSIRGCAVASRALRLPFSAAPLSICVLHMH